MADDLDSSNKGIWILPYEPTEAGPSRPRPLRQVYANSLRAYRNAHETFERQRTEEQVDDVADWLDRSSARERRFHRLPVGIIQQPGKQLHSQLEDAAERLILLGIQGRDMTDLASAIKSIASGFVGDVSSKTGLTGLDQVEAWFKKRKDNPSLLLHIQEAQIVQPQILAEVIYILTLHPDLPFRLLLSVPSVRTFLSQWSMIEPSSIDLSILSSTRTRRRHHPLSGILDTTGSKATIRAGEEMVDKLKLDETMFGQGPEGALRSLQWSMLHHEANSPLATLLRDERPSELGAVKSILESLKDDPESAVPGRSLFELQPTKDLDHVLDPSPRISILHALANSSSFRPTSTQEPDPAIPPPLPPTSASPKRSSRKRQNVKSPSPPPPQAEDEVQRIGDLKDLEVLYGLWKGAGKNVNLWDWLQGYQGSMAGDDEREEGEGEGEEPVQVTDARKRRREDAGDVDDQDRLHATFVRFCEEARMLGLVRARGKGVGRRGDEVVKSVTLV